MLDLGDFCRSGSDKILQHWRLQEAWGARLPILFMQHASTWVYASLGNELAECPSAESSGEWS